MPRKIPDDALATARLLLVEYYESGRRRHTLDSIARRARVSRATVGRLACEVRKTLPTMTDALRRISVLERRIEALERSIPSDSPHLAEVS